MTVSVDVNGRRYTVELTRRDGAFLVSVDGRQREVDVRELGGVMSLLVGVPGAEPSRSYDVSIAPTADGRLTVHVDGLPVEVFISPARPSWAHTKGVLHAGDAEGPQRVAAPMPGKIVKLLVKAGDRVAPRQGLVVVEAMKMENELKARAAGTVAEVLVAEGSSVEAGAILVILE